MKVESEAEVVLCIQFPNRLNFRVDALLSVVAVVIVRFPVLALVAFFDAIRVDKRHGEKHMPAAKCLSRG